MTGQQLAEQRRLEEILKLARMQLNEEYMKKHSVAHTSWLTSARTAWNTNGILLPFVNKFVYPSEEEVVARGVEIFNTLNPQSVTVPLVPTPVVEPSAAVEKITIAPTVELLQAGGDFIMAEVVEEEITDVVIKEEKPILAEEPPAEEKPNMIDSLLENKFKSLFTKWGGRGSY